MINKTEINTHLEFLGYTTDLNNDDEIYAAKPDCPSIIVKTYEYIIAIKGYYNKNNNALSDRLGFLEYVNRLNKNSRVALFTEEGEALGFYTSMYHPYERKTFAIMMRAWEYDLGEYIHGREMTKIYLSPDCPEIDKELLSIPENDRIRA